MTAHDSAPRSRRALLTAAAGAVGALAATAALPAVVAAHDTDDVQKGVDNPTTATTTVTDSGADSTSLAGHATGTGYGYGVEGTSAAGAGVFAWSISSVTGWDPPFTPAAITNTGIFGFAPQGDGQTTYGVGVWGDSPDTGVYGTGGYGVEGFGFVGVAGYANGTPGSIGVHAWTDTTGATALSVDGKVHFSRSGRKSMASKKSSVVVSLAGVTSSSKVFAVLASSESGRWVRAAVPASGKFTVYLNTALTSGGTVAWFVLD